MKGAYSSNIQPISMLMTRILFHHHPSTILVISILYLHFFYLFSNHPTMQGHGFGLWYEDHPSTQDLLPFIGLLLPSMIPKNVTTAPSYTPLSVPV